MPDYISPKDEDVVGDSIWKVDDRTVLIQLAYGYPNDGSEEVCDTGLICWDAAENLYLIMEIVSNERLVVQTDNHGQWSWKRHEVRDWLNIHGFEKLPLKLRFDYAQSKL